MSLFRIAQKSLPIALLAIALTACGGNKTVESSDVSARQALMKDWRSASDIIKGMTENPDQFDAAVLQEQAKFLDDTKSQMWAHFADANAKGKATDAVWSDPAGFAAATAQFDTAVSTLNATAQSAQSATDIESALGQVGESCGSCHKVFKQ